MVTVIDYRIATNAEGEEFFMLVVQGGVESVQSKETGRFYLTARKATVSCTFNETTCEALIGTKMPGQVFKKEVEPYNYVIESTGEEILLHHRYEYHPSEKEEDIVLEDQFADELVLA